VQVNRRAAARLRGGYLWVYRSDLLKEETPFAGLVHVADERGKWLGTALSSSSSQIALRMISRERLGSRAESIALLRERVRSAVQYRKRMVRESDSFRVIFSEGDLLPGYIVDKYNDIVVLQALTQAANDVELKQAVVDELQAAYSPAAIRERVEPKIRQLEQLPPAEDRALYGEKTATKCHFNGLEFGYNFQAGQKTGAFLDQRENYAAAEELAFGDALDVFTYQGGFALHLARKCKSVTAVDVSREALEGAEQNEVVNRAQLHCEVEWMEANAFDLLKDYAQAGHKYDTIVLDPPAFAKSKRTVETALRGYKELNLRALKMLRGGGVLVTNSCSHHVSEAEFIAMLAEAAADAHRAVRIVAKRTQAADHPILVSMPETYYLKCVIAIVE
jgi:23S rRNA (cytosine1962-C5)-methyltransferase